MGVPKEFRAGIEEILTYKPYFEQVKDDQIARRDTESAMANEDASPLAPIMYRNPIIGFVEDAYKTDILETNYVDIMKAAANEETLDLDVFVYGLPQAGYQLTMAVLTCIIRQEQYCQGLWEIATREKWFLMILNRLEELMNEED